MKQKETKPVLSKSDCYYDNYYATNLGDSIASKQAGKVNGPSVLGSSSLATEVEMTTGKY